MIQVKIEENQKFKKSCKIHPQRTIEYIAVQEQDYSASLKCFSCLLQKQNGEKFYSFKDFYDQSMIIDEWPLLDNNLVSQYTSLCFEADNNIMRNEFIDKLVKWKSQIYDKLQNLEKKYLRIYEQISRKELIQTYDELSQKSKIREILQEYSEEHNLELQNVIRNVCMNRESNAKKLSQVIQEYKEKIALFDEEHLNYFFEDLKNKLNRIERSGFELKSLKYKIKDLCEEKQSSIMQLYDDFKNEVSQLQKYTKSDLQNQISRLVQNMQKQLQNIFLNDIPKQQTDSIEISMNQYPFQKSPIKNQMSNYCDNNLEIYPLEFKAPQTLKQNQFKNDQNHLNDSMLETIIINRENTREDINLGSINETNLLLNPYLIPAQQEQNDQTIFLPQYISNSQVDSRNQFMQNEKGDIQISQQSALSSFSNNSRNLNDLTQTQYNEFLIKNEQDKQDQKQNLSSLLKNDLKQIAHNIFSQLIPQLKPQKAGNIKKNNLPLDQRIQQYLENNGNQIKHQISKLNDKIIFQGSSGSQQTYFQIPITKQDIGHSVQFKMIQLNSPIGVGLIEIDKNQDTLRNQEQGLLPSYMVFSNGNIRIRNQIQQQDQLCKDFKISFNQTHVIKITIKEMYISFINKTTKQKKVSVPFTFEDTKNYFIGFYLTGENDQIALLI